MFVSKKGLPAIHHVRIDLEAAACVRLLTIKLVIRRQRHPHRPNLRQRLLAAPISGDFETSQACCDDLNVISFLEVERFDDRSRETHCQAVAPLGDFHGLFPGYMTISYIPSRPSVLAL